MSDEQTEHTEMSALKASMRAVTEERNRLRQEVNSWKEQGATWEARDKNLSEQVAKLQGELASTKSHHEQDLHLSGLGITSKRGRRAIRREYSDAVADLAEGAEAPVFGAFVDELKADPLYGRWFSTDADKPADKPAEAAAPPKARRKPAANPNAGAAQPKAPVGQMTAEAYGNLRAKHGRKAGRVALELLRKQGIVK